MSRKYGIKIKHRKNIYLRRKSTFRKTVEISGVIILAGGLCMLGFAAGKPIMDYIQRGAPVNTTLGWTEPVETQQSSVYEVPEKEPVEEEVLTEEGLWIYAPAAVLQNKTSLSSYLITAKNEGAKYALVELKDSIGGLWFKSDLPLLRGTDIIKGDMTLSEISSVFQQSDITPIPRISTLQDKTAPKYFDSVSYWFRDKSYKWIDNTVENGGKLWADPTSPVTLEYLTSITDEIRLAGFDEIVLSNTIFPPMRSYDISVLPTAVSEEGRYTALLDAVKVCGRDLSSFIEINVLDIAQSFGGYKNTAELLKGVSDLEEIKIIAVYEKLAEGTQIQLSETSVTTLSGGITDQITFLFNRAASNLKNVKIIPCIENEGLSDSEIALAKDTLYSLGYGDIVIK